MPGGVVVLFAWARLMIAAPSQSAVRYVMYWCSAVVVPGALVVGPYLVLARTMRRGAAVAVIAGWVVLCLIGFAWLLDRAISEITIY
jgi:hypothetical protein